MTDDNQTTTPPATTGDIAGSSARSVTMITYVLFGLGYVVPLTTIVGVILAHIKRKDAVGTIYESHLTWLIRTFWFSMLGMIVGVLTMIILIGWIVILATAIWGIYRLVIGFIRFNDTQAIANPTRFF